MESKTLLNVARACGKPSKVIDQLRKARDEPELYEDEQVQVALGTTSKQFPLTFISAYFGVSDVLSYLSYPEEPLEDWYLEALCVIPGPSKEEIVQAQEAVKAENPEETEVCEIEDKDCNRLLEITRSLPLSLEKGQFMARCFFRGESIEPLNRFLSFSTPQQVTQILEMVLNKGFANHLSFESLRQFSAALIKHDVPLDVFYETDSDINRESQAYAGLVAGIFGTEKSTQYLDLFFRRGLKCEDQLDIGSEKLTIADLVKRYDDEAAQAEITKKLQVDICSQSTMEPGCDDMKPTAPTSPKPKQGGRPFPKKNDEGEECVGEDVQPMAPCSPKGGNNPKTKALANQLGDADDAMIAKCLVKSTVITSIEHDCAVQSILTNFYQIAIEV